VTLRVPLPARLPYQITERERSLTLRLYGGASDHQLDAVRGGGEATGKRPAGHADELCATRGGRGDDHARAGAARVGGTALASTVATCCSRCGVPRDRSRAPAPRPNGPVLDPVTRPSAPRGRRDCGSGGDAGRGLQGKGAARARRARSCSSPAPTRRRSSLYPRTHFAELRGGDSERFPFFGLGFNFTPRPPPPQFCLWPDGR